MVSRLDPYNPFNNEYGTVVPRAVRDKYIVDSDILTNRKVETTATVYSNLDFYLFKNSDRINSALYTVSDTTGNNAVVVFEDDLTVAEGDILIADYFTKVSI